MLQSLLILPLLLVLVSCGPSCPNCNQVPAGTMMTHEQLAQEFIRRVGLDVHNDYRMELVKTNTQQEGFIVVYRPLNGGMYNAIDLREYRVNENALDFLNRISTPHYYSVVPVGDGRYVTNPGVPSYPQIYFTKVSVDTKNLAKLKALRESLIISEMTAQFRIQYGLSLEKSNDLARFSYKIATSPRGTYNINDYDAFVREITGSTITQFQVDIKNADMLSLNRRIELASQVSGIGAEGMAKVLQEFYR